MLFLIFLRVIIAMFKNIVSGTISVPPMSITYLLVAPFSALLLVGSETSHNLIIQGANLHTPATRRSATRSHEVFGDHNVAVSVLEITFRGALFLTSAHFVSFACNWFLAPTEFILSLGTPNGSGFMVICHLVFARCLPSYLEL